MQRTATATRSHVLTVSKLRHLQNGLRISCYQVGSALLITLSTQQTTFSTCTGSRHMCLMPTKFRAFAFVKLAMAKRLLFLAAPRPHSRQPMWLLQTLTLTKRSLLVVSKVAQLQNSKTPQHQFL